MLANMISVVMIGKINEHVSENGRVSYLWWGANARKKFRQLYPCNRLVLALDSCVCIMVLCFILAIRFWVFG